MLLKMNRINTILVFTSHHYTKVELKFLLMMKFTMFMVTKNGLKNKSNTSFDIINNTYISLINYE